jgi:hypothetical protein
MRLHVCSGKFSWVDEVKMTLRDSNVGRIPIGVDAEGKGEIGEVRERRTGSLQILFALRGSEYYGCTAKVSSGALSSGAIEVKASSDDKPKAVCRIDPSIGEQYR